jgi:DNA-binding response OmpR family regulator
LHQILLVDDNAADVFLMREAIRTSKVTANIVTVCDPEQALRFLAEANPKPDLIMLDLNLPGQDGFYLLERQRTIEGPPIIVLTSSHNPQDKSRALELGARDYVLKPLDLPGFFGAIHAVLEKWLDSGA